jgi:hypothetical protein
MSSEKTMANPAPFANLQDQLNGQQGEDGEGDGSGGGEHADEVPQTGPDDGDVGLERMRIDDGSDGIRRVVKAVDELESERDEQRDAEQNVRPGGGEMGSGEIVRELRAGIDQAGKQSDAEDDHPDGAWRPVHLLVDKGAGGVPEWPELRRHR